jgi:putative endonuclease
MTQSINRHPEFISGSPGVLMHPSFTYLTEMKRGGSTYILTNTTNDVLYIGVTSQLFIRMNEHREGKFVDSFTSKYNCSKLVYYENFLNIEEAIAREKQLKNWRREWKQNLINKVNPQWRDLSDELSP